MVRQRPVERIPCGLPPVTRYQNARDYQLVRVETDELADYEGINRGDWIVLDKGVAVGVIRAKPNKLS